MIYFNDFWNKGYFYYGLNTNNIGHWSSSQMYSTPTIFFRLFPVFHAYMSGIVSVLDQNPEWGDELINLTLQLLLFSAAPKSQKRTEQPDFTLIRLSQPMRRTWLMTLLIILYKVWRGWMTLPSLVSDSFISVWKGSWPPVRKEFWVTKCLPFLRLTIGTHTRSFSVDKTTKFGKIMLLYLWNCMSQ